jgi:hypothetical protein
MGSCLGCACSTTTLVLVLAAITLPVLVVLFMISRKREGFADQAEPDTYPKNVQLVNESPGTPGVLVIEDKLELHFVMDPPEFDDGVKNVLVRQSLGKFKVSSSSASAPASASSPPPSETSTLHVCNVLSYAPRGNLLLACTNDAKHAYFIASSFFTDRSATPRSVTSLVGKTVAYLYEADVPILERILWCLNMRLDQIKLLQIEPRKPVQAGQETFECIFVFMNAKDEDTYDFLRTRKVGLYHYNDIRRDMVHKWLPCAQLKSSSVKAIFPRYVGPFQTCIVLEGRNVVYATTPSFNYLYDLVIQYFTANFDYLNFFERYYRVHPRAQAFQTEKNAFLAENRSNLPILEQFAEPEPAEPRGQDARMVFRPAESVPGMLNHEENTFVYPSDILIGTPLIIGDHVVLENQTYREENGEYVVRSMTADAAILERRNPRYPVTVDTDSPNGDGEDETYFCVTDPKLLYKHECLSAYDTNGFPKTHVDVWDGPCRSSLECPFFRYDPHSDKFEGRCINGYCAMPSGYTRIGFKKFVNQDGDQWLNIEPRPRKFASPSTKETRW